MKKDNFNYLMVGSFVLVALFLLLAMLFRITGAHTDADNYYVLLSKITGIKDGSAVTYGGYQIGKIDHVEPVFENGKTTYRINLKIRAGWKIPQDSVAKIAMPGIISDKQIEITEGVSTNKLKPGDTINSKEAVDMMTLVNDIGNQLDNFIPDMAKDVSHLLSNLNESADQVAEILNDENRKRIENMFKNADDASYHLAKLSAGFDRINGQLDEILKSSKSMLTDNNEDIRHSVIGLRKSIDVVSENIHSIIYNMDASSRNMNEFTRQLRDNPGAILGSKPPVDKAK